MLNKIKIMQSSVAKWNKIIEGQGSDGGVLDCPPCRIYYVLVCAGCPIAQYAGKKFCRGSPYPAWYWHQNNVHGKFLKKVYCPECIKLATDMRDFMQEILDHLKAQAATQTVADGAASDKTVTPGNSDPDT